MPLPGMTDEQRCTATAKRTGERCQKNAMRGQVVCRSHGGASKQARAAAEKRLAIQAAHDEASRLVGRVDIHPGQALLELVQAKAYEVAYWERRVNDLAEESLTWGLTKIVDEPDGTKTTEAAQRHVALGMLHQAQHDLAEYSAAALRADVDESMVKVAQSQAVQLVEVLRAAMSDERVRIDGDAEAVILDAIHAKGLAH